VLTATDHQVLVDKGLVILNRVNERIGLDAPTFLLVGNPGAKHLKYFWYKVRCKTCGDLFILCPPLKNLALNLKCHIHGLKTCQSTEDATANLRLTSSTLSIG
jgi:hypothetical protein